MSKNIKKKHLDISNLGFTKNQLLKLFELEAELISIIVHDVLGPLRGIAGYSEILVQEIIPRLIQKSTDNPDSSDIQSELSDLKDFSERMSFGSNVAIQIVSALKGFSQNNQTQVFVSK